MSRKALIYLIIFLLVCTICALYTCKRSSLHKSSTIPEDSGIKKSEPTALILPMLNHKYYSFSYSEEHEQPVMVHYMLFKKQVGGKEPRKNKFYPDPLVSTLTANDADFYKSGYDKGHLVPAADMSWSEDALNETFYYSNICPQDPSFNRGIWKKLEEKVRRWAIEFDSIEVYAGPVFKDSKGAIGPNQVTIPGYFYKILGIYSNSQYQGIGFILPNRKVVDSLITFAVTIDSVEHLTSYDFFEFLPDQVELKFESTFDGQTWFHN